MRIKIRQATTWDAEAVLAIYRPVVEDTACSFEIAPPDVKEMSRRIDSILDTHEWLVAEGPDGVAGYSYASQYRAREAYRFTTETTVYVRADQRGKGVGQVLYSALFKALGSRGFRRAYAGIALPNTASIALHKATGFEPVGIFPEAGFKFDRWHDVSWWQRKI